MTCRYLFGPCDQFAAKATQHGFLACARTFAAVQAEKADAVKRVKALQSASKETDSSAKAELAELKLQLETKQQQLTEHRATCSAAEVCTKYAPNYALGRASGHCFEVMGMAIFAVCIFKLQSQASKGGSCHPINTGGNVVMLGCKAALECDQSLCYQGQVEEAQKQVDKLTTELGHAKKAYKKLESDSDLNSKQSSKALQDLKKHLAAAERDADDSQSALKEV